MFEDTGSADQQSGNAAAAHVEDQVNDPQRTAAQGNQGGEDNGDLFDAIFKGDQPSGDQSSKDQDAAGSRGGESSQRADQAGEAGNDEQDGSEAKQPRSQEDGDEAGLVEVELGDKKIKVSAEAAAAIEAQRRDYKALEAEFTRRNQQANNRGEQGRTKDQPDPEQQRKSREEVLKSYDERLFKAMDLQDGKGASEAILEMIDRRAQALTQRHIERFVEDQFTPLVDLITESLGPQIIKQQIAGAIGEIEQQYGISGLDADAVHKEAEALARRAGTKINRELMLTAALRVLAGRKADGKFKPTTPPASPGNDPSTHRPAAPRRTSVSGGQGSAEKPPEQSRGVVHRADPLDAL